MSENQQSSSSPASENIDGDTVPGSQGSRPSIIWDNTSNASLEDDQEPSGSSTWGGREAVSQERRTPNIEAHPSPSSSALEGTESTTMLERPICRITPSVSSSGWTSDADGGISVSEHTEPGIFEELELQRVRLMGPTSTSAGEEYLPVYSYQEPGASHEDGVHQFRCPQFLNNGLKIARQMVEIIGTWISTLIDAAFSPNGLGVVTALLFAISSATLIFKAGWLTPWELYNEDHCLKDHPSKCQALWLLAPTTAILSSCLTFWLEEWMSSHFRPDQPQQLVLRLYPLIGIAAFSGPAAIMSWDNYYQPTFWYIISAQAGLLVAVFDISIRYPVKEEPSSGSSAV